jgi:hypothetical protein
MINLTPRELPPSLPSKITNSFFKGSRMAGDNILLGIPLLAFEAGTSQPGEQIPTLTGRLAGIVASPALMGLASAGMTAILGIPPAAAAIGAMILVGYAGTKLEDKLIRGLSYVSKAGMNAKRLSFGGNYEDTVTAQKRRQRSMKDLVGAMPQARQWLGQEALALHR